MNEARHNGLDSILKYLFMLFTGLLLLYWGKTLFIPMFFGLLVAIVMYPVCKWMESKGAGKSISIGFSLGIVSVLIVALLLLLTWQIGIFQEDIPEIAAKLKPMIPAVQQWITDRFSITIDVQDAWLNRNLANAGGNISGLLGSTLNTTISTLFMLFMIPIFTALFLFHRSTFVRALGLAVGTKYKQQLQHILSEVTHTYFRYIKGMIMVYIIVGILNSAGLFLLGIPHALLFGMLTAIMTIIPYVGIIISALLPISVAFITKDSAWYPVAVVGVFIFVQYLEANVIFPKVVGTQLNVSTWATLVGILLGGIIWGVSGMVLFIPFVAILKIITDHLDNFKALNLLLSR